MSEEERRERHRQNYMHVATHTAQARGVWGGGGVSGGRAACVPAPAGPGPAALGVPL